MSEPAREPQAEHGTIRLPKEIVRKLGIIAQHGERSIGEIVAGWIGPKVDKEDRDTIRSMTAELGEAGA